MSYDLVFWRQTGPLKGAPADVYSRLCKGEAVEGVGELTEAEIREAFVAEFPDLQIDALGLHGPMFSILLRQTPIRAAFVNCSWKVSQRTDILERIIRAGKIRLHCGFYNPQVDMFVDSREGG